MREPADLCPVCGRNNNCSALDKSKGTCWCVGEPPLPPEILTQYEWRPCFCESCYDRIISGTKENKD
ncbi:MAG: cysteine-rich CWC family protein [Geovibrio sp.]|nr:cysteine-rich CWC family protein [Geovibrio sp.]